MQTMQETTEKTTELRKFGLTMMVFFALMFGLLLPWLWALPWPRWPWAVAGIFGILALVQPTLLRHVHAGWMRLAHVLGWVNTRVVLGLVFLLVFTPWGCIMRLLGRDTLQKGWDASVPTYRINKTARKAEHMERQF